MSKERTVSLRARMRGRDDGAILVELAFVLPVLLSIVLGSITGGEAYFRKIGVTESVREGARFGASLVLGPGPNALADWEASVKARVVAASGDQLSTADVCAKLVLPIGGADCGVGDPAGASLEPGVHLAKVSATKNAKIEFLFFSVGTTLRSRLAARYERDTG